MGVALKVTHFAARRPVLFALVPHALCHQARDVVKLLKKCATMVCDMEMLRQLFFFEVHRLCRGAPVLKQFVLNAGGPLKTVLSLCVKFLTF